MADFVDGDDVRSIELELLRSMYDPSELIFPDPITQPYSFTLLTNPIPSTSSDSSQTIPLSTNITLPQNYPEAPPSIYLTSPSLSTPQTTLLTSRLNAEVSACLEDGNEMMLLQLLNFLQCQIEENFEDYPKTVAKGLGQTASQKLESEKASIIAAKNRSSFARQWCSFVSLYKDSYISGPNRFEVLTNLAKLRGLKITGLAISGKPGGIVIEGGKGDVEEYMRLIRTEFFETLNPRGRKITVRLEEELPEDEHTEKFEYVQAKKRSELPADETLKGAELERFLDSKRKDETCVKEYEQRQNYAPIKDSEYQRLKFAEKADEFEGELTEEDIDRWRIFEDFRVEESGGYEGSFQEAAKLFKEIDRMDGFNAMFSYRFS
ncbi:hypothetical protein TrVE_jg3463 [Triparma verrucosa]|uniref:RWD domain-containing protein n=1 Tax=Triparma verrucosa TaxID=1606542 RepID=A0A9W7BKG0_9STRA|nr:hypothetical protein TrVE_jg3463 [Triparma verrucosa]